MGTHLPTRTGRHSHRDSPKGRGWLQHSSQDILCKKSNCHHQINRRHRGTMGWTPRNHRHLICTPKDVIVWIWTHPPHHYPTVCKWCHSMLWPNGSQQILPHIHEIRHAPICTYHQKQSHGGHDTLGSNDTWRLHAHIYTTPKRTPAVWWNPRQRRCCQSMVSSITHYAQGSPRTSFRHQVRTCQPLLKQSR